jgi:hypothetical protein
MSDVGLYSAPIERNERLWSLGLDQFTSTTGQVTDAAYQESIVGNPTALLARSAQREMENKEFFENGSIRMENPNYVPSRMLEPDEANNKFGVKHGGKQVLSFDQPIREREAEELNRLKMEELQRQDIINRGAGGFWQGAARLSVGLGASVIDPLNVLSAFIPVVGPARYSAMLANAGTGVLARAGVRAGVGAVEGLAGAAMLEPLVYGLSKAEQRDYTMVDSLANLAFGTVLGGGLHVPFGALADRVNGIGKLIDNAPSDVKQAMLGDALAATMEGRPVRADLALREHLLGGTSIRTPYEMARAKFDNAMGPFGPAERLAIDMDGMRVGVDPPHPMPGRTGSAFPVLAQNGEAMSFTTEKRAENAARRIEREQGYRPEIVETPDGFMLRRESDIEPVRKQDGTVMTFENQRQAERYRDQILKDPNLDVIRAPNPEGGPHRYALVAGATDKEIAAAAKAPHMVDLRPTRDVPDTIQRNAESIAESRAQFERDIDQWLADKREPKPRFAPEDLRAHADQEASLAKARSINELVQREGGKTEQTVIEREIADLDAHIKAIDDVGELPAGSKELLKEGDDIIKAAEERGQMFERIAACLRGSA